jgi:glycosyltransferase involved in cell wall biosynthesis
VRIICVVWIDFPPSSLYTGGWRSTFRGLPIWLVCAEGLQKLCPIPVVIVCPLGTPDLTDQCEEVGCQFFRGSSPVQISCLVQAVETFQAEQVLFVHGLFGIGLIPISFLRDACVFHSAQKGAATIVEDLPKPLAAMILEKEFLDLLHSAIAQAGDSDVFTAVGVVARVSPSLVVGRFSFTRQCGISAAVVPAFIPWIRPNDLQRIEAALAGTGPAQDAFWPLRRLRDLIVDHLESRHHEPRKSTPNRKIERLLFASSPSAYSGSEECLVNTVTALRDRGLEIESLIAAEGLFSARMREAGAKVHCPNDDFSVPSVEKFLWLDRFLDRVRPSVIHCNAVVGLPLLAVSRLRGIPLVQWVRVEELGLLLDHLVSADLLTAVSEFTAGQTAMQMVRKDKIRVLYDCVDTARYSPTTKPDRDIRRELGIAPDTYIIVCIARFIPRKRHDVLIRALPIVAERHPNTRLVLVGEREPGFEAHYEKTINLIRETGQGERITFLGFQRDVLSVEAAADVVVLCSDGEPLGTVILESMALGRPVVVSASGGLPEMVRDGISGLHCAPGNHYSLAAQIDRLLDSNGLRFTMGSNARQRALEVFSMDAHAERLLSLYEEMIEPRRGD